MTTAAKKSSRTAKPRGYNFAGMVVKKFIVPIITAISQADVKSFGIPVGFGFRVTKVETYCLLKAGVVTAQVKIGAVSVLAANAVITSAATVNAPLVGGAAKFRGGKPTDTLNVHYTTDAAGVLTNGFVIITVEATGG